MLRPPQILGSHDPSQKTAEATRCTSLEFFNVRLILLRRLLLVVFHVDGIVHHGKLQILTFEACDVLIVDQRQPDVVEPAQKAVAPKRVDRELITQPAIVGDDLLLEINSKAVTLLLFGSLKKLIHLLV